MDNGTQFTGKKFLQFYDKQHIWVDWAAVTHPRTNGQVKRANGMLLQGLKPRIFNQAEQVRRTLGRRAPYSALEPKDNS